MNVLASQMRDSSKRIKIGIICPDRGAKTRVYDIRPLMLVKFSGLGFVTSVHNELRLMKLLWAQERENKIRTFTSRLGTGPVSPDAIRRTGVPTEARLKSIATIVLAFALQ